jgi:hypothetical protein
MADNSKSDFAVADSELREETTTETPTPTDDLTNWMPGADENEGLLILSDGSLRKVVRVQGLNSRLFDPPALEKISRNFSEFVASLEAEIQIVVTTTKVNGEEFLSEYHRTLKTDSEYISWYSTYTESSFNLLCDTERVQKRNFYVIVACKTAPGASIEQEWNGTKVQLPAGSIEALERQTRKICEGLTRCNLKPSILIRRELRTLLEEHNCLGLLSTELKAPEDKQLSKSVEVVKTAEVAENIEVAEVAIKNEHLRINNKYVSVQHLAKLPEEIWIGWLGELLTIGVEHTLSIFIRPTVQVVKESELKTPRIVDSSADLPSGKINSNDYPEAPHFKPIPAKYLEVGLYIRTEAATLDELKQQSNIVDEVFSKVGAVVVHDTANSQDTWQSSLPLAIDKRSADHVISARVAGTFWPFFTNSCGTSNGMILGLASESREPVMLNPFFRGSGKDNNNILISGATAGQTFVTMMLILRSLPLGVHFILLSDNVDRFSSYHFLSELLGPELCARISLSDGSGNVINPFDLSVDDFRGHPSGDKVRSLLSFFDLILAPEGKQELSLQEKALLDRLILKAYEEAEARDTVPTMSEFTRLVEQAASEESDSVKRNLLQNLACGLSIFTRPGAYSSFLDGFTNVAGLNKKLLVCETKNITGHRYQKAAAYVLNQFIEQEAQKAKSIGRRLGVLVHQSSGLMISEPGLQMLESLSRRSRQYGMMFGVITDQLRTLCSKVPVLIRNAHTKFYLRSEPGELSLLKKELRLTDTQIQSIENFSLNTGSLMCMLTLGDVSGIVKLIFSPLDYWICTSEPVTDIPERMSKIAAIKLGKPGIAHGDACRLAVYSLSQESKR